LALQTFPNARVIVTGYYPMVSEESDTSVLGGFLAALGALASGALGPGAVVGFGVSEVLRNAVAKNCAVFAATANLCLELAVIEANRQDGSARARFAHPRFTARNAVFAPQSLLWECAFDPFPEPLDPVQGERAGDCETHGARTDVDRCKIASLGHPDPAGARRYFDAIAPLLP